MTIRHVYYHQQQDELQATGLDPDETMMTQEKMMTQEQTVKRPILYIIVGALAICLALPLALASGQTELGGLFDECYTSECTNTPAFAGLQKK